ncbi:MAG: hypothetical protein ABSH08_21690, partial [Tepidisphaeraceae bacterium]
MADTNGTKAAGQGGTTAKAELRKIRKRLVENFYKQAQPTGDAAADAATRRRIELEVPSTLRAADATLLDNARAELLSEV